MNFKKQIKSLFGSQLGPFIALLFIILLFGVADHYYSQGNFTSARNIRTVLDSAARITVPALGMTIIIIAAGIDLSAGTALTLCGTVLATQLKFSPLEATEAGFGMYMAQALAITILIGCACGLFNGLLISLTKVVPFIVTLGTMTIFLGIGQIVSKESTVNADLKYRPDWLANFCYTGSNSDKYLNFGFLPDIPASALLMFVLLILVGLMLRYTVFGRNIFAVGSSESTARLCGVNVPLTTILIYTLAGAFVGIGGFMNYAFVNSGDPQSGMGMELKIIAAVVLGGGSLNGGRGSVVGTFMGALIIAVISSGCVQLTIPNTYTHIIIGGIIIVAVIVDQLRHGSPEWFFRMLPSGKS
jgi:ribose/xylose/arabinose/galactoside ABC-type transport system permease subunit